MIQTYLYRLLGAAACVGVITNVYKHGWHPPSIVVGVILAVLTCSLGIAPERRNVGWEIRYVTTVVYVVGLAAFRFLW
jgi:hypothetical protein